MAYYHDDPIEDEPVQRRRAPRIVALILAIAAGGFYIQTTLAANISINSGNVIQFGQGFNQTISCSGASTVVKVTPYSNFTNASGSGSFYFNSVEVSNIPVSCYGVDFTIDAYDNSTNTPMSILNTTDHGVLVYNNAGTFTSSYGTTITSGSGTFKVALTVPQAISTSVGKLVLQSSAHSTWSCAQGGTCIVGSTGPGGGQVYETSGGFSCGPTLNLTCKYKEQAPGGWSGSATDPLVPWAISANTSIAVPSYNGYSASSTVSTGSGLAQTNAIVAQNGACASVASCTYAAGTAKAYSNNGKTDWYLPGGGDGVSLNGSIIGQAYYQSYWYADEGSASTASWGAFYAGGGFGGSAPKSESRIVHPVRAF